MEVVIKNKKVKVSIVLQIVYLLTLVITFFYVRAVLDAKSFKASEKTVEKTVIKKREAAVTLNVVIDGETKTYKAKLTTLDTVEDFLKLLRSTSDFIYEKELYTYGAEIDEVFNKKADEGKRWVIMQDKTQITDMAYTYLANRAVYTISQAELTRIAGQ